MMNKKLFVENWIKICVAIVVVVVTVAIANVLQDNVSAQNQYKTSLANLQAASDIWSANEDTATVLTDTYHKSNQQILYDLKRLMEDGSTSNSLQQSDGNHTKKISINGMTSLDGLINDNFAPYVLLMDAQGNVAASADKNQVGTNLCDEGFFTTEELAQLLTFPDEGLTCTPAQGISDYCFYATSMEPTISGYYLVMGFDNDSFKARLESLESLATVVEDANLSDGTAILEIKPESGVIGYCSDDDLGLGGTTIERAGIPDELLKDQGLATISINGATYICASVVHTCDSVAHTDGVVLIEAVPTELRFADNYKPTVWAVVLLVMTLIVAVHYALLLPRELTKNKKKQKVVYLFQSKLAINLTAAAKVVPLLVLGIVLIFGSVFYCRTILKLSWAMDDVDRPMTQLVSQLSTTEAQKKSIEEYCDQMYLSKAQMIASMIEENPSCLNEATKKVYTEFTQSGEKKVLTDNEGNPLCSVASSNYLQDICQENDFVRIQVFNDSGYVIASSDDDWRFQLSHDSSDQSSAFYSVIDGSVDYLVQSEQADDEGNLNQYTGVAFNYYTTKDDDGSTRYVSREDYQNYLDGNWSGNPITAHKSVLQCASDATIRQGLLESLDIEYIMGHISLANDAYMVVFDNSSDHKILYTPNKQNMGKTAAELDITSQEFSGSFNGFQMVGGVEYYEVCRYMDGYYVAIATPTSSLYANRLNSTLCVTIACLIAMIVILLIFLITTKENMDWLQTTDRSKPSAKGDEPAIDDDDPDEDNEDLSPGIFDRWLQGLYQASAKNIITYMIRIFGMLIGIYFLFGLLFGGLLFADNAVINYVFSDSWEHGFNIFALTKGVVVLVVAVVGVNVLTWFVNMVFSALSANAATIANFLTSLLRYVCVIAAIFYCLYLLGMDSMSLLASAGILSLIIGLGAQSLISDMLASVFIIFEGYYHVGDLVKIDKELGEVVEIGIRSTKVKLRDNTIAIYNNSGIKDAVNMSVREARVRMKFAISLDESLQRVEEILKQELPQFPQRIPQLIEAPTYLGVPMVDDSCMYLLVVAKCKGTDYLKVNRAMNCELQHLCEKYSILTSNAYYVDVVENPKSNAHDA